MYYKHVFVIIILSIFHGVFFIILFLSNLAMMSRDHLTDEFLLAEALIKVRSNDSRT